MFSTGDIYIYLGLKIMFYVKDSGIGKHSHAHIYFIEKNRSLFMLKIALNILTESKKSAVLSKVRAKKRDF
jgi:hypothetical protein